jgi:hypothetical protein
MGKYRYLSGVIGYTFALYAFVVLVFATLYYYCRQGRKNNRGQGGCCAKSSVEDELELSPRKQSEMSKCCGTGELAASVQEYFDGKSFEYVYRPAFIGNYTWMGILLTWRVIAFCYLFAIPFLWNYSINPVGAAFFTLWNIDLLCLYFFLTIIASIIGFRNNGSFEHLCRHSSWEVVSNSDHQTRFSVPATVAPTNFSSTSVNEKSDFWSKSLQQYGFALQILFEIAGATAFFVTVIAFATLNHKFVFFNTSEHFVTSIFMLGELILNDMDVRWEHILLNLAWAVIYLIYVWPMTRFGALTHWPYFFLETETTGVFVWYTILFIADVIFYFIFYLVFLLKLRLKDVINRNFGGIVITNNGTQNQPGGVDHINSRVVSTPDAVPPGLSKPISFDTNF